LVVKTGLITGNGLGNSAPAFSTRNGLNSFSTNWDGSTLGFYVDSTNVKNFIIPHPDDPARYLVHTSLEGPEWGPVYYRGTSKLQDGEVVVNLPDYFESLTKAENRTITLTCKNGGSVLYYEDIKNGQFKVKLAQGISGNEAQEFSWLVMAERKGPALQVEPRKDEIEVKGFGPYRYYTPTK